MTSFLVDQSPEETFRAINNVRGWWEGEIEGDTNKLGAEFTYRYEDFHRSKQRIIEFVPGKKVIWLVLEGGPRFVRDKSEWKDTKIIFDISKRGNKTEVRFTHQGLIPRLACYESCTDAWGPLIRDGLRRLITTNGVTKSSSKTVGTRKKE
jgi:hypothetical protein